MSIARHHAEWLSLIEVSGPFLSMPVLMRVFPQGMLAHDPGNFRTLKLAYDEWEDNNEAGARINPALHSVWIKFVLVNILNLPADSILEYQAIPQSLAVSPPGEHAETIRPNLVLNDPATGKPRLLIQTYPLNQDLDKAVAGKSWKASPGTRMMELLHATGVQIGLVTNGQRWMLVDAPKNETTGFASWYANLWIEEKITLQAFISLMGAERFFGVSEKDTLEQMLKESAGNQQEVTDQLGYQVRNAVEVLVQAIDRINQDRNGDLLAGVAEKLLYEAALTYMMRLVFLFCAEERRLFPLDNELYAQHYAASTLRDQLRRTADDHGEEILERRHDAWSRLLSTFRLVYGGCEHPELRMPAYAGHLFDPDRFTFLEGRKASTSWRNCEADPLPVNNRTVLHLLEALQLLQVKVPGSNERQARRLSFRALDIEQIGHVYEGLLDHTAKRATEPMLGLAGGRDNECELPLSMLEGMLGKGADKLVEFLNERTGRSVAAIKKGLAQEVDVHDAGRLRSVCGNDENLVKRVGPFAGLIRRDTYDYPEVIQTGSVFVTAGTDRRSSGTHYTPRSLTEPIVQYTLEPLVYIGPAEGTPKDQWKLRPAKELLDLKICDMACGSGAFLVQGCRYMADRLLEAWERAEKELPRGTPGLTPEGAASTGQPGETLIPTDPDERQIYARRIIAQRCLYGVDINPLATEMAKLSLWLLTLAKNKPFTFLDHNIRCGDSLLGIHNLKQLTTFSLDGSGQQYVFGEVPMDEFVEKAIELRIRIESMPSNTADDIEVQSQLMAQCEEKVEFLKCAADMLIAAEFNGGGLREMLQKRDDAAIKIGHFLKTQQREEFRVAAASALGRRSFNWPLEFPELIVQRGGFDAFVGNPPFMRGKSISTVFGDAYQVYLKRRLASVRGSADLVAFFFIRAVSLLRAGGCFGLVATNTIAQGDTREVGLDQITDNGVKIYRALSSRVWPGSANVFVAIVHARLGGFDGPLLLDEHRVSEISPFLSEQGGKPHFLAANNGIAFQGSNVLGMGFTLEEAEAKRLIEQDSRNSDVLLPFLNGEDINSRPDQSPSRWIINFYDWPIERAEQYAACFEIVARTVKPTRLTLKDRAYRERWWQYGRRAVEMYEAIRPFDQVLTIAGTSRTLAFVFMPSRIVFSHMTRVFALNRGWHFAVLQSAIHEHWIRQYASTMKEDQVYSQSDCFDNFPLPGPIEATFSHATDIGKAYYGSRKEIMRSRDEGLTSTYNHFHDNEHSSQAVQKLRDLHVEMDKTVAATYHWDDLKLGHDFHQTKQGMRFTISEPARREVLARLLKLNHERYAEEVAKGLHDKKKPKKPKPPKWELKSEPAPEPKLFE